MNGVGKIIITSSCAIVFMVFMVFFISLIEESETKRKIRYTYSEIEDNYRMFNELDIPAKGRFKYSYLLLKRIISQNKDYEESKLAAKNLKILEERFGIFDTMALTMVSNEKTKVDTPVDVKVEHIGKSVVYTYEIESRKINYVWRYVLVRLPDNRIMLSGERGDCDKLLKILERDYVKR